jgi:hypothetical protein
MPSWCRATWRRRFSGLGEPTSVVIVRLEPHKCPLTRLLLEAGVHALELADEEWHPLDYGTKSKAFSNDRATDHSRILARIDPSSEASPNAGSARWPWAAPNPRSGTDLAPPNVA